ncbi:uncharacterized protein [Erythrolamprus reginae]|uniref:uncharacterized protein n=1 Tax=Erythrolamprus reginae TaxID=121349 RepID=UPI00396C3214
MAGTGQAGSIGQTGYAGQMAQPGQWPSFPGPSRMGPPWMSSTPYGAGPQANTKPTALLCGHSMIFWAGRVAARSAIGTHLSLGRWVNVTWMGRRGMRWEGLLPALLGGQHGAAPGNMGGGSWSRAQRGLSGQRLVAAPRWLVLHLGGNDLCMLGGLALLIQAREDLRRLREVWPATQVVWSDILPRIVWRDASSLRAIHRARRRVNRAMGKTVREMGGVVIPHPLISIDKPWLYRNDGVHLSDQGNAIFLQDLQRSLRELAQLEGGVGGPR